MTREEIARVIAPDAWRKVDWLRRNADTSDQTSEKVRGIWRNEATDLAKSSLAKADAILAKLHQDAGSGEWPISTDGPHPITDHRQWLARQLLDSQLSEAEAISIVKHFPADALERGSQVGDGPGWCGPVDGLKEWTVGLETEGRLAGEFAALLVFNSHRDVSAFGRFLAESGAMYAAAAPAHGGSDADPT